MDFTSSASVPVNPVQAGRVSAATSAGGELGAGWAGAAKAKGPAKTPKTVRRSSSAIFSAASFGVITAAPRNPNAPASHEAATRGGSATSRGTAWRSKGESSAYFARFSGREAVESQLTGEALAQLNAEKANPKTDIWFGGTGDPHLQAAEQGLTLAEPVADYLLRHHSRDLRDLLATLDRLERATLAAQRHPTLPFVRELLAAADAP